MPGLAVSFIAKEWGDAAALIYWVPTTVEPYTAGVYWPY